MAAALPSSALAASNTIILNKEDRAALKKHQDAVELRHNATAIRNQSQTYDERIRLIEELIDEAAGDEARLQQAILGRMVSEYERSSRSELALLVNARSVGDLIATTQAIQEKNEEDKALVQRHKLTLMRLEELKIALQELRNGRNDRAATLEDTATRFDLALESARDVRLAADLRRKPKSAGGADTWYSSDGQMPMTVPIFGSTVGSAYSGGTVTARRKPNAFQIALVLADPRIEIYAGGRSDIAAGRIDGRVLDAILLLTQRFGSIHITSLMSGHGVYTASGNISQHSVGCAMDIGSVNGTVIMPSTQGHGSITEQAVQYLAGFRGDLAPHQVISLNSYGGPTLAMGDHGDHIHVGYHC